MSNGTLLVLGGRSDIGLATARAFAAAGWDVQLAARDATTLEAEAKDIALRHGVAATCHEMDATDLDSHAAFYDRLSPFPHPFISILMSCPDLVKLRWWQLKLEMPPASMLMSFCVWFAALNSFSCTSSCSFCPSTVASPIQHVSCSGEAVSDGRRAGALGGRGGAGRTPLCACRKRVARR